MDEKTVLDVILNLRQTEVNVLYHICQGSTNEQIRRELGLVRSTIENSVTKLHSKFEIGGPKEEKRRKLIKLTQHIVNELIPNEEALKYWERTRAEKIRELEEDPVTEEEPTEINAKDVQKIVQILAIDKIEGYLSASGDIEDVIRIRQEMAPSEREDTEEIQALRDKADYFEKRVQKNRYYKIEVLKETKVYSAWNTFLGDQKPIEELPISGLETLLEPFLISGIAGVPLNRKFVREFFKDFFDGMLEFVPQEKLEELGVEVSFLKLPNYIDHFDWLIDAYLIEDIIEEEEEIDNKELYKLILNEYRRRHGKVISEEDEREIERKAKERYKRIENPIDEEAVEEIEEEPKPEPKPEVEKEEEIVYIPPEDDVGIPVEIEEERPEEGGFSIIPEGSPTKNTPEASSGFSSEIEYDPPELDPNPPQRLDFSLDAGTRRNIRTLLLFLAIAIACSGLVAVGAFSYTLNILYQLILSWIR